MFADSMEYCSCVRLKKNHNHKFDMYFTVDFPFIYYMPLPPKKVGDEGQDRVNSKFYMYV